MEIYMPAEMPPRCVGLRRSLGQLLSSINKKRSWPEMILKKKIKKSPRQIGGNRLSAGMGRRKWKTLRK